MTDTGYAVVIVRNVPSPKRDIVRVYRVRSVSVLSHASFEVRRMDVYVLQQHILAVDECHGPHLGLHETETFDDRIREPVEGELVWSTWIVARTANEIVP